MSHLGAAAFISGVVASSIIIIRPFCPRPSDVIRDTIFFLFGCFWVGRAFSDEKFHYVEAIGTIFIYILYLAAVFVDHFWDKIGIKRKINHKFKNKYLHYNPSKNNTQAK